MYGKFEENARNRLLLSFQKSWEMKKAKGNSPR